MKRRNFLTGAAIGIGVGAVVAGPPGAVVGGVLGAAVGGPRRPAAIRNAGTTGLACATAASTDPETQFW